MHYLTKQINNKGYSLGEFLAKIGFSLRWYREHSQSTAKRNEFLKDKINELSNRND
jgi:hypothetical protein